MSLVIITVVVSFFLDGILSNFIPISSNFFIPLFSLISFIIIYPYFNHRENDYVKTAALIGFCYDMVYTDTIFLECILFILIAFFIRLLNEWFSNNIVSITFMTILVVALYRSISYGVLSLVGFFTFDFMHLFQGIYSSLLLNIIYAICLYLVTDKLSRKYHVLKVD